MDPNQQDTPSLFDMTEFTKQAEPALNPRVIAANVPAPKKVIVEMTPRTVGKSVIMDHFERAIESGGKIAREVQRTLEAPGKAARDKAMAKVEKNADSSWKDAALAAVRKTAMECEEFIVDAVWLRMPEGASTHEGRAMGAIMVIAKNEGVIQPTDRFEPSIVKGHHACPRRIWKSLVYGAAHV